MNVRGREKRKWYALLAVACSVGVGLTLGSPDKGKAAPTPRRGTSPPKAKKSATRPAPAPRRKAASATRPSTKIVPGPRSFDLRPNAKAKKPKPKRRRPPKPMPPMPQGPPIVVKAPGYKVVGKPLPRQIVVRHKKAWPANKKLLNYVEEKHPTTYNPLFAKEPQDYRLQAFLFESLVSVGWDHTPTPLLASSWVISPRKRSITFTLRRGVRWHDGRLFTAQDVAITLKHYAMQRGSLKHRVVSSLLKRIVILRPDQIRLEFRQWRKKLMAWIGSIKILPAHQVALWKTPKGFFAQKPIGTGPFRFHEHIGRQVRLLRNHHYWRPCAPSLTGVQLRVFPDLIMSAIILRYYGVDLSWRVPPSYIRTLARLRHIRMYPYSSMSWWMLAFNQRKGAALADVRLREAIALALDRETLRKRWLTTGATISGPFSPNDSAYNFNIAPRKVNLVAARKRLDQAGWKRAGKWRVKNGTTLQLRLLGSHTHKSSWGLSALYKALQTSLAKIGISVKITWHSDKEWHTKVHKEGRFDMLLVRSTNSHPEVLKRWFGSKNNPLGYQDAKANTWLKECASTNDPHRYKLIRRKLHARLHRTLPALFLWRLTTSMITTNVLRFVSHSPRDGFGKICQWQRRKK